MHDLVEGNFLRNASGLLPFRRKNVKSAVTKPCVGLVIPGQAAASQSQSLFFTQLPPEVRALIYAELLRGAARVVHIVNKLKKRVDYVKCKGKCSMEYNFKCQAGTEDGNNGGTLLLIRTCQKAYVPLPQTKFSTQLTFFQLFRSNPNPLHPQHIRLPLLRRLHNPFPNRPSPDLEQHPQTPLKMALRV